MVTRKEVRRSLKLFDETRRRALPKRIHEFFDQENEAISKSQWEILYDNIPYRRVNLTGTKDGMIIYTLWIGYPLRYGPNGPDIFETVTFDTKGNTLSSLPSPTEKEALRTHNNLVRIHGNACEDIEKMIDSELYKEGLRARKEKHKIRMRLITEEEK